MAPICQDGAVLPALIVNESLGSEAHEALREQRASIGGMDGHACADGGGGKGDPWHNGILLKGGGGQDKGFLHAPIIPPYLFCEPRRPHPAE